MNSYYNKKSWSTGVVKIHVEPPPIPKIKNNPDLKTERNYVKIKLGRNPNSEKSDMYEFILDLFDNGKPDEFLLSVRNFNMNL